MQAWGTGSQEKRSEVLFPQPSALPTHPQRPSLHTWRVPLGAQFQLLGQAGHSKGAGPGGLQAVASSEVGALQAPETEEEKVGGRLGRVCHVGHPHAVVLGNTSLCGGAAPGHLCLQTNLSPRDATLLDALRHSGGILPWPAPPQAWVGGEAAPSFPPTVTFKCLTTGSAGRG